MTGKKEGEESEIGLVESERKCRYDFRRLLRLIGYAKCQRQRRTQRFVLDKDSGKGGDPEKGGGHGGSAS